MKLRNKKTGEIGKLYFKDGRNFSVLPEDTMNLTTYVYNSLAELNEDWEDYEEPKEYWYLENNGDIDKETYEGDGYEERMKEIGNYFETKEEAEKVAERLNAWKRLKDKGFKFEDYSFTSYGITPAEIEIEATIKDISDPKNQYAKDLMLLFGGEE